MKEAVNDQYDYIDWWLYEATDDYTVWEADCTMKYCLKEPEALYDYITGMQNLSLYLPEKAHHSRSKGMSK